MNNAFPMVCNAMKSLGPLYDYKIIYSPPIGKGRTLEISYCQNNTVARNKKVLGGSINETRKVN